MIPTVPRDLHVCLATTRAFAAARAAEGPDDRRQCFGELVNRNDSWITTPGLKTTDILLTESGKVAKLFLRQPLFEPNTPNVLADQFAHIHAQRKINYII